MHGELGPVDQAPRLFRRRTVASGLAALGLGGATFLLRDEAPRWRTAGSAAWPLAPQPPLGSQALVLPPGGTVICQGDSNTRGNRVAPGEAWPDRLAALLGGDRDVVNLGRGGATVADAAPAPAQPGDIAILCFGSNDAAPRGWLRPWRRPVPPERYEATLADLAIAHARAGAHVLVMAPPPVGSEAMARRLAPYRPAARRAAAMAGVAFADPATVLGRLTVPLQHDALHLTAQAHETLARWLADMIATTGDQAL